jgi:hypothetical protein
MEQEPLTVEGFEVWDILMRSQSAIKWLPSGHIIGFDLNLLFLTAQNLNYGISPTKVQKTT